MTRYFNHAIIDDFLPLEFHDQLLKYALDNRDGFEPNKIYAGGGGAVNTSMRKSFYHKDSLGPLRRPFRDVVKLRFPQLVQQLGLPTFEIAGVELELAAHRDGSFFKQHIDTLPLRAQDEGIRNRMISVVYYLHTQPKRFSGGELALAPLGHGEAKLIEPRDNRLVAFPSFAPHEVKPIVCPTDDFDHARFAVNCWLYRNNIASKP